MRTNAVKRKLAAGEPVIGSWLALGDVTAARVMARAGFDYLCLDLEHTAVDWRQAEIIFGMVADAGCVPLCRVPDGTTENIKKALDAGAWGIVAPMVNTVAQARVAVDACYYPPLGLRSVGGGTHYLSFGASDDEYKARANQEIVCVLMTESPEGVANAPAIYALEGVDAAFVGPNDLKSQFTRALPGGRRPTEAEFEAALQDVQAAGAAAGTPVGIHTFSTDECAARVAQGFRFMAMSSDAGLLGAAAGAAVAALGIRRGDTGAAGGGSAGAAAAPAAGGFAKY